MCGGRHKNRPWEGGRDLKEGGDNGIYVTWSEGWLFWEEGSQQEGQRNFRGRGMGLKTKYDDTYVWKSMHANHNSQSWSPTWLDLESTKTLGTPVRALLDCIIWGWKTHPQPGPHLLVAAHIRGQRRRKPLPFACLSSLLLVNPSTPLLWHPFAGGRNNFFRIPV